MTIIPDFGERYLQTALFERFRYEGSDGVDGSAFRFPATVARA